MKKEFNPYLSVDCVVFGFDFTDLKILLIQRNSAAEVNQKNLKLPGSLVLRNEDLDTAAQRTLFELTGLKDIFLQQFYTFGSPNRIEKEDEIEWIQETYQVDIHRIVSIGYYALINIAAIPADSILPGARWEKVSDLKELAMDHFHILNMGLEHLRKELKTNPILGYELLPNKFTIRQYQTVYEVILGKALDNRNFRKKILSAPYLKPLDEKQKGVPHKPAQLYRFDEKVYQKSRREDYGFSI